MKLDGLSTEEIKEIMKQLLYRVEADHSVVDRGLKHRKVYKFNSKYCVNFYNGYEYKICSIDDHNADISSESLNDNVELTKYYKQLLANVISAREELQAINI